MRRLVLILSVLAVFLIWLTSQPAKLSATRAQQIETQSAPSASPSSSSTPVAATPELQCQGCHASGKTLPYLGGALFHAKPHTDYDHGFHALAIRNGGKGAVCLDCHARKGDMTTILTAADPRSTINRANIAETCGRCHGDKSMMLGSGISDRPFLSYRESVHAKAIARGDASAAVCTDCHNSHDILPASNAQSSIAKVNIAATCGKCHQGEASEFIQSVHGEAVSRGVSRAPACTDCHGIHGIDRPHDKSDQNAKTAIATDSCATCHEGVTLTQEFGIASGRVSSYKDSYHGLASRFGSKVVANCSSCHGVHNILPSTNANSMISARNLPQTCGQCHVGASANFAAGKIHLTSGLVSDGSTADFGSRGTQIVRWIYLPMIVLVIGGMLFHNALVWRKKAAAKRREKRSIVRLTVKQRIQHWFLLTSFIALVLSGFALQYPDSWLAWSLGGNEALRRLIHRIAAVVMLVVGLYHLLYLALTQEGRQWVKDMLPRLKDIKDLIGNFAFYLGFRNQKPKLGRFGYAEKAEYWAVVWGTVIMGLTGLMIWFKISVFSFLARWWIDIALAVHFYEAVLATLAIIVWHFYQVIFDPDVYPANFAFLDGRVSEESYKEEHELAYEEMQRQAEEAEKVGDAADSDETPADGRASKPAQVSDDSE